MNGNDLRYTIETKDEHGWLDYAILTTKDEAISLAKQLKENFGDNIRVIDRQNMIEIEVL